jgi:hypothetical protein
MPITLKESSRQLLIFSDRPLTWLSPIMTILCLLQADVIVFFVVFSCTLVCSDVLCFIVLPVSFLDIRQLIIVGMMSVSSSFFLFDC